MSRIAVTDPQGRPGYIEEGDTTGETFTLDPFPAAKSQVLGGAVIGGTLGRFIPVPFASSVLAGVGGAAGKGLELEHRISQGERVSLPQAGRELKGAATASFSGASLFGGGARLAKGAYRTARGIPFLASSKQKIKTAERGRAALGEVMGKAGDVLEQKLGQLKGSLDLTDEIGQLQQAMQSNPGLAGIIQQGIEKAARVGDTVLIDLLTSPNPSKVVSALQGQQVLATLRMAKPVGQALGRAGKSMLNKGGAFLRQTSDEALDLLTHIKGIQSKAVQTFPQAFPEIVGEFAKKAHGFRELVPKFKKGALVGNIARGFGDPEIAQTVRQTLPADIVRELFFPSQAKRNIGIVAGAAGLGGGAAAVRRLFSQQV